MNCLVLFQRFEAALQHLSASQASAYMALCRHCDFNQDSFLSLAETSRFFSNLFDQAHAICEAESQRYFPNDAAVARITEANKTWSEFCQNEVMPFLAPFQRSKLSSSTLRLVASDAITFYEWANDVGYLQGSPEQRKLWLAESPLADIH